MKIRMITILAFITVGISVLDVHADGFFLQKSMDDTTRIRLLNSHAFKLYEQNEFDSCLLYASKALNLSGNLLTSKSAINNPAFLKQSKVLKAKSLTNIAMGLINNKYILALDTLQEALSLIKEAGTKEEQADIYAAIAAVYDFTG